MPDDPVDPRLGAGGNKPPLTELLAEETRELKALVDDAIDAMKRLPPCDSEENVQKVTSFAALIKARFKKIDDAREERKKPAFEEVRAIDAFYKALYMPLVGARPDKEKGGIFATVHAALEDYAREQQRLRREEQQRLEKAAREAEEAAKASALAAQQAAASSDLGDQLEAEELQEKAVVQAQQADQLGRKAEAIQPKALIRGSLGGSSSATTKWKGRITDLNKALKWARGIDEDTLRAAVQSVLDKQVAAKVHKFKDGSGVEAYEDIQLAIRS